MTSFRHDPPTCDTALQRLDALPLSAPLENLLDSESQAAWDHVRSCPDCAAQLQQRRAADQHIAELMSAVPIPVGLKERLLAQAEQQASESSEVARPVLEAKEADEPSRASSLRRRSVLLSVATALLVAVSSGLWLWIAAQPKGVALQALFDHVPMQPAGLNDVTDWSELPPLPTNWPRRSITRPPCWFAPTADAAKCAWMSFEIPIPKQAPVRGVLLSTVRAKFADPPADWLPTRPQVNYTQRNGKPVAVAAWSERGFVYVCFVPGDATQLERLLDRIAPTPA